MRRSVNRQLAPAACFPQTGVPHQSPRPMRCDKKQTYLWTLCLWNDASSPCPPRVATRRNASRRADFTLLGKCFLRHADVGNGFSPPAGQFGKTALTVSRDEIWILTAQPVLCASGALITCQGQNNYSLLCWMGFYFFPTFPFFLFGLLKWIGFPSAPAHKADAIPSPHSLRLPSRCVLWRRCGCNCLQDQSRLRTKDLSAVIS